MAEVKNTATWRDGKNNILRGVLRDPNYYSEVIDNVGKYYNQHIFNIYAEITAPNKKTGECDIVVLNIEVRDGNPDEENISKLLELLATPGAELTKMEFVQRFDGSINWYSAELGKELKGKIGLKASNGFNSDSAVTVNELAIFFKNVNDHNYASLVIVEQIQTGSDRNRYNGTNPGWVCNRQKEQTKPKYQC